MTRSALDTSLGLLAGVGPAKADLLREQFGLETLEDLLRFYPFRHVDRSRLNTVADIAEEGTEIQLLLRLEPVVEKRGTKGKRMVTQGRDASGTVELIWFKGAQWIERQLKNGGRYLIFGKPQRFGTSWSIAHPEFEPVPEGYAPKLPGWQPVYHSGEKLQNRGLGSNGIARLVAKALDLCEADLPEFLPEEWLLRFGWPHRARALRDLHFPPDAQALRKATDRIKFEELLLLQIHILQQKHLHKDAVPGWPLPEVGTHFHRFYSEKLPFELTEAQKRVVREIRSDTRTGMHMNRLVQGDVGSGKTVVALMAMLLAWDNGHQSCLMAPTEILAQQHHRSLSELLDGTGLECGLLTGSVKNADRKPIEQALSDGTLPIVVGTHALLEDRVQFRSLGLAVIDEQHRFGVEQRARLWAKNHPPPHILVMTATPIPRTLAMTVHGDLDLSVIDELPPGRKPVHTVHYRESKRLQVWGFLRDQLRQGRQAFVIFPLIEESETLDYKDLMSGFESLLIEFPRPEFEIALVHGRQKPEEKDEFMRRFADGVCQILVATTVVEVGVNVPNATVMIIENAERFGLAQLHQLRGRVGRGAEQSHCILMTGDKLSKESLVRLETMVSTNDGFKIAEVDLQLRGPGDLLGTQQSGLMELKLASLSEDAELVQLARRAAEHLLSEDPTLSEPRRAPLRAMVEKRYARTKVWGRIG
ncbi:ATP-dependent DNA helicase RecG [bacterium]|nr:ATP-dependent DNA helicase RecG [bacterium]